MKRILLFLLLGVVACGKESGVSPGNASTFVRYFNGGNNDVAASVIQTSDKGLLILATTQIKLSELSVARYKIKLIKTDANGNELWQRFYPEFAPSKEVVSDTSNYQAGGIYVLGDGTIAIAGTHILKSGLSNVLLLTTDKEGLNPKDITLFSQKNTIGTAVSVTPFNGSTQYLISGTILDEGIKENLFVARVNTQLTASPWSTAYGNGIVVSMANKVYLDPSNSFLFSGGTINRTSTTAIRLADVQIDTLNPGAIVSDVPIGNPAFNVVGNDFCRFGQTWAFVGSTDEKKDGTVGDFDILYERVDLNQGIVLSHQTFPIDGVGPTHDGSKQNDVGNSICTTQDGGLLLLGTVNSQGAFGRGGKDYYLIKINAFGTVEWTELYGSKFDDNGVQVIQASDGGYIVLGTTTLANLKSIMLMKTGKDGKIQ